MSGEVFKVIERLLFNLRMRNELYARNSKAERYGTEAVSFLCPKIWALVPQSIKDFSSLPCFKKNIGKWKTNYPCRLCKIFLKNVGFV